MMEALLIVCLILAIVAFLLWLVLQKRKSPAAPPTPAPPSAAPTHSSAPFAPAPVGAPHAALPPMGFPAGCSLQAPWKFYATASIDNGRHGVTLEGDLLPSPQPDNWSSMRSNIEDAKFALRPPMMGDGKWSTVVREFISSGRCHRLAPMHRPHEVLLVEAPACVILSDSSELEGLVVRRGGTVLLCPLTQASMVLSLQFAIVESGGVLQCGYSGEGNEDKACRLDSALEVKIQMVTPPQGYLHAGVPCSQYPPDILQPGCTLHDSCYSDYPGSVATCLTNATTPKSLAVLFNGNLHMAGSLPSLTPYSIWAAMTAEDNGPSTKINADSYVTAITLDIADGKAADSYPTTWTRATGAVLKGATELSVVSPSVKEWPKGAQIVVTALSSSWTPDGAYMDISKCEYSTTQRGDENFPECTPGVMPYYVDEEGAELQEFRGTYGVEVCRIDHVEDMTIYLAAALKLDHMQKDTSTFTDTKGRTIEVTTSVHVGLLTRNIRVCGRTAVPEITDSRPSQYANGAPFHNVHASDPQSTLLALPRGKFNKVVPANKLLASERSDPDVADPSTWAGPGGSVVCGLYTAGASAAQWSFPPSIYRALDAPLPESIGSFLHGPSFSSVKCDSTPPVPRGSYLLGDPDCNGLDCILGGSVKVQYGASFVFDGVELYQMGLPGNCGSLGQYSLHFHCAGWGPKFTLYTAPGAIRHLRFCNSSNWRSYSRWAVLHGTKFAHICNNVFCTGMGNGVFLEDGVEHNNNIEHNLMTNCIMTGKGTDKLNVPAGQTQNPGNVIGNAGFDNYPVASIWLTNTCNFVHRNVICNNATSGIAVWAVPINPRTKSGPGNLCTGLAKPQLPGLIGKALIGKKPDGSSDFRLLTEDCVPADMRQFFTTVVADGSTEAIGNLKNYVSNPALQSYVLFAENTIYSMNGGLVEANNEDPIYVRRPALFEATSQAANYMPINAESAGSLISNNPQDYPRPGMTIAQADVQAQSVPRALFQNLVYGLYGVKVYQFGGFVWIQQGPTICIGNCVLGGEFWSAGSSFKAMVSQEHLMGNFAGLHIDMITNCSVTGSGNMGLDHKSGCQGILVSGPKTILGADTCIGARTAVPPNSVGGSPCVPADDDAQPSFVMFADGIAYADVKALILKWLTTYKNFAGAAIDHFTALDGLANGGKTCCTVGSSGWYCGESRQDLQYVFFPDENLSIGLDTDFALKTTTWNPKDTQGIPAGSVPLCNASFSGAAVYAAKVYPALGSPAVVDRWNKACACIGISPGAASGVVPEPPSPVAPVVGAPTAACPEGGQYVGLNECRKQSAYGVCWDASKPDANAQCLSQAKYHDPKMGCPSGWNRCRLASR